MMNRRLFRRSSIHALLLLFAVMPLAAPLLHAATMAHSQTTSREPAFCGLANAALEARLPNEIRAALAAAPPDGQSDQPCSDCVCTPAAGLLPRIAACGTARPAAQPTPDFSCWRSISDHAIRLPPSTGPPGRLVRTSFATFPTL